MTNYFKKLPIGIENFKELREDNFYYVDKTQLIEKLLQNWGKANLFTRPRRFGKSLTMSMLKHFFEIGCDPSIFDGLYISQNQKLCQQYMGKFPVISISLKGIHSETYSKAKAMLIKVINEEPRRFQFLLNSGNLTKIDKELFLGLLKQDMNEDTLVYSLRELTELLNKHFQQKVIVLIDEYDVPLAKADEMGYYNEMVLLIRNLFENVLKTNDYLYFSVLTGCLRVAKESIFTGLNNFKVYPITNVAFDEYFGFTDFEVKEILKYYHQTGQYETVKTWYDGYHFGDVDIYCPWDVICFCEDHRESPDLAPQNYWLNTSGNQIIRHFIENMGSQSQLTKTDLELLLNGSSVQRTIRQELTYKDLYSSPENLWSALFMTGYLTQKGLPDGDRYDLVIRKSAILSQLSFLPYLPKPSRMTEKTWRLFAVHSSTEMRLRLNIDSQLTCKKQLVFVIPSFRNQPKKIFIMEFFLVFWAINLVGPSVPTKNLAMDLVIFLYRLMILIWVLLLKLNIQKMMI